jgi:hypothetical protein
MAWSKVTTEIQNPAGKRSSAMTAKQIKFFGTKRQKAALKAKRSKARHSAKRHTPAKRNAAPKKHRATHRHSAKRKAKSSHRSRPVKRNPPELVAFLAGNSASKGRKKVAHSTKKRKKSSSASHRKNAGSRRGRKTTRHSSRRRGNPAGISVKEMVYGGGGGLVGFFGSAGLAQMFLGSSNSGMTGYAVAAAATIGLTILSHMLLPREKAVTLGVAIGGVMNLGRKIITDQTPFGAYLNLPPAQGGMGMGDYMMANWGPPNMTDGLNSAMAAVATTGSVAASSGINMLDYADIRAGSSNRPC